MGHVASGVAKTVAQEVASSVASALAQVAMEQLKGIANPPESKALITGQSALFAVSSDAENINSATRAALAALKSSCIKVFKSQYAGVDIAGTDDGFINGYNTSVDPVCAVKQMAQDFSNWDIPIDGDAVTAMVTTIRNEMAAKSGQASSSYGMHWINQNQRVVWSLAYGEFAVTTTSNGLLYAFSAPLDTELG